MNSQTSTFYKNNNSSQEQGNNIFIYPTPITNSSERGTQESDSISEENKVVTIAALSSKKKNSYFKKIQRLGALTTSYFGQLFRRMGTAHSKNERNSAVRHTASTTDYNNKTCWRKRLKFQRKKSNSELKQPQFIWYFRPVGAAAAFKSSSHKNPNWTEFEKKNQVEFSRQLSLLDHHATTKDTFEIQDKNIFDNTVVVTVMLKEGIAFVLNPEWSKPITYQIHCAPKLHWYQEIYRRHKYRQMLRDQHKAFKSAKFP